MDGHLNVTEAVRARYSCRAFRPDPVPREMVAEILALAAHAPSGGNLQPWHVDALTGEPLAALKAKVAASLTADPKGEGTEFPVYPPELEAPWRDRRFVCGEQLYASIGIPRDNRPARLMQFARNFDLFGAPVGLFFSIPRSFGAVQWGHLGMFIQTIMRSPPSAASPPARRKPGRSSTRRWARRSISRRSGCSPPAWR